jgi:hypothetical protein
MGYIKDQVRILFSESGGYARAKSNATNWFMNALNARSAMDVKITRKRFEPGKIYVFKYDTPLTIDKLEWWDRSPVVLALYSTDHTDIGINLNLLPAKFRQEMLDVIYEKLKSKIKRQITENSSNAIKQDGILELRYENIKTFLDKYGFGFAIRRYIPELKKNQSVVSYESWPKIAICEFAKIEGSTIGTIRKEFKEYNTERKNQQKLSNSKKKDSNKKS